MKSSLRKDDDQKIKDLKQIISLGKKIGKDVRADEKKLEVLERKVQRDKTFRKNINSIPDSREKKDSKPKLENQKIDSKSDILFSVKNVYTKNNQIIIEFNKNITKKDINFFELNQKNSFRDVYDINGYFKDALATKLEIDGKERVTIAQFKPNILRIVLSNNRKIDSTFSVVNSKKIVINVEQEKIVQTKKDIIKPNITQDKTSNFIDYKNNIREIYTENNSIFIKFNKNFSQKNLKYLSYQQNGKFEDVFEIQGRYQYANPIKLSMENTNQIITTQERNFVRLKLLNNSKANIVYNFIDNKTLKITHIKQIEKESKPTNIVTAPPVTQKISSNNKTKKKTIVIDAGHGGSDAGAVGPKKRYEKVVNLAVSNYLADILKKRGYKVYVTRSSDKFIKVMDRTILANEKNADLFLSIHTNAMPKDKANSTSGIETFFLSPARSERAKRVAALENQSDIREMNEKSKDVFLESLNRPRITASHKFAIDVQAGLLQAARSKYKDVNDSGVREGPFWVLVGAQMPSILIELGYISHPEESRRLYEASYQKALANGIANGIDSYFLKNP
ncbi:N-acetylmuramoyl-L-alanine amidase family protein [Aliarcobacter skirrowii]|uniref:N-acetylmuramoyl-L-alanine amidase n=2 Tax=Aliarcobacter skirrowii TaxID=28200 RepID=A0AAD0SRR4_9BACT|nr:N-acetylmuramoyl-L-alanine amidase [Aliarcobacter skirrowii]AXX85170.1 N-acetylmuramoyl-L-alanine amidase [Aliarcobacter skirrowii CCUG 10374]SUU96302.1 N-acetylmuramoyl-L-alanine amidase AmiA precursor [Aliarcobacter skirrowii]